eukprot:TRINITY_DN33057_c0_g1_i1.p1 TRINITY_DN33057_c0_g1~~TRINITY_DN33057_c0_g1_i1.p1  ORF type:complete len:610 (+),score=158.02 TRINITY_DN33057_c0_g1_i1:113-1942(+)
MMFSRKPAAAGAPDLFEGSAAGRRPPPQHGRRSLSAENGDNARGHHPAACPKDTRRRRPAPAAAVDAPVNRRNSPSQGFPAEGAAPLIGGYANGTASSYAKNRRPVSPGGVSPRVSLGVPSPVLAANGASGNSTKARSYTTHDPPYAQSPWRGAAAPPPAGRTSTFLARGKVTSATRSSSPKAAAPRLSAGSPLRFSTQAAAPLVAAGSPPSPVPVPTSVADLALPGLRKREGGADPPPYRNGFISSRASVGAAASGRSRTGAVPRALHLSTSAAGRSSSPRGVKAPGADRAAGRRSVSSQWNPPPAAGAASSRARREPPAPSPSAPPPPAVAAAAEKPPPGSPPSADVDIFRPVSGSVAVEPAQVQRPSAAQRRRPSAAGAAAPRLSAAHRSSTAAVPATQPKQTSRQRSASPPAALAGQVEEEPEADAAAAKAGRGSAVLIKIAPPEKNRLKFFGPPGEVVSNLLVGSMEHASPASVKALGITAVVSVMRYSAFGGAPTYSPDIRYFNFPFCDNGTDNIPFVKIAKTIAECLSAGLRVLVHCKQGISRSVSSVVAYLMLYHEMSVTEGLARVKEVRPAAAPKFTAQLRQVNSDVEAHGVEKVLAKVR